MANGSSVILPRAAGIIRRLPGVARACAALAAVLMTAAAWAGSVTYTHDALGRLKTVTYSNGVVIAYTYDASGNRVTVVTTASPA